MSADMPTLTTPTAATASSTMGTIINGELSEQIDRLIAQGNLLEDPNVWNGVHAATFRSSWPHTRAQLTQAVEQLGVLRSDIERIRTDIVRAGGGAG